MDKEFTLLQKVSAVDDVAKKKDIARYPIQNPIGNPMRYPVQYVEMRVRVRGYRRTSQDIAWDIVQYPVFWDIVKPSKMTNLLETNADEDEDQMKQPYNNQQLEECDQYSNETDTFLVRIDGDTHRITHQALVNNQILFTQLNPPLLCIRHDVRHANRFHPN